MRKSLDAALMAYSIAQAGEPELARLIMLEAQRENSCCGELEEGRSCIREIEARCMLALQQGS